MHVEDVVLATDIDGLVGRRRGVRGRIKRRSLDVGHGLSTALCSGRVVPLTHVSASRVLHLLFHDQGHPSLAGILRSPSIVRLHRIVVRVGLE